MTSVVIVGSGLAGLISAITSLKKGKKVTILEKMSGFGGNSTKASSGINLVGSKLQKLLGINDNENEFLKDTLESCGKFKEDEYNPNLVRLLCTYSKKVEQLMEEIGITLDQVNRCGGHSLKRTHRNKKQPGIGFYLIKKALDYFLKNGGTIIYDCKVTELLTINDEVVGVKCESGNEYHGKVILATGGYERSVNYIDQFNSNSKDRPTTAGFHCTGDGLDLGCKGDADLVGMKHIQLHPTGIVDPNDPENKTKFLAPEALRGVGGKLFSLSGEPIGNELVRRDQLVEILDLEPDSTVKLVLDDVAKDKVNSMVNFYKSRGLCVEEDGLTIFKVCPVIHYTMGGLRINRNAQVLDKNKKPIKGLYAAGEVTGGIHGKNRLAGNSLLECCVFGIIAGNNV